jgi:Tol biopolymer transport system component
VAVHRSLNGNTDIWLLELGRGLFRRLTFDPAIDIAPVWSPDGRRIAFQSNRAGRFDIYWKLADGTATEELLLATPQTKSPLDWSPDGRFLLYRSTDPKNRIDLWALDLVEEQQTVPIVQTSFDERDGQFSPDGKWIAYQSDESGQFEIYVQPFPGPGSKSQISTDGGSQVRWRQDGRELFYIGLDDRLMAVPISLDSKAMVVDAATPISLFPTRIGGALQGGDRQQYLVSADGQRFLMNTVVEEAIYPLTVILNWKPSP